MKSDGFPGVKELAEKGAVISLGLVTGRKPVKRSLFFGTVFKQLTGNLHVAILTSHHQGSPALISHSSI